MHCLNGFAAWVLVVTQEYLHDPRVFGRQSSIWLKGVPFTADFEVVFHCFSTALDIIWRISLDGLTNVSCALQAGILLPQFIFCWYMFKWEHEDLVPIRPHEGEELPANPLGPRMVREAKFLATLEKRLTSAIA